MHFWVFCQFSWQTNSPLCFYTQRCVPRMDADACNGIWAWLWLVPVCTLMWWYAGYMWRNWVLQRTGFATEDSKTPDWSKTWRNWGLFGSLLVIFDQKHAISADLQSHPTKSKFRQSCSLFHLLKWNLVDITNMQYPLLSTFSSTLQTEHLNLEQRVHDQGKALEVAATTAAALTASQMSCEDLQVGQKSKRHWL